MTTHAIYVWILESTWNRINGVHTVQLKEETGTTKQNKYSKLYLVMIIVVLKIVYPIMIFIIILQ